MLTFFFRASTSSAYFLMADSSPFRGTGMFCTGQHISCNSGQLKVISGIVLPNASAFREDKEKRGSPSCPPGGLCMPSAAV